MTHTFIIAEAGINHDGDPQRAIQLVDAAKEAGCDAIKFQTYQTDLRVDRSSHIYDILKKCELSYEQTADVKWHADKVGIEFFSTPFDEHSLAFLVEDLGVRRIKLASFDVTNSQFLMQVNEYAKRYLAMRVILSTGMANAQEIDRAIRCMPDVQQLALLHCISSYPTPDNEVNLEAIRTLRQMTNPKVEIGYSDHTTDILIPALSVLVGATTIEKHFTLDLNGPGVDNPVSADPAMMKDMVEAVREHEVFLGDGALDMRDVEHGATPFRRFS